MKKIAYIYYLVFLILLACTKNQENSFKELVFNEEDISLKDSLEFQFIPLETKEECLIGVASDIKFYRDYIFILEGSKSENLYVFKKTGEYICQIGRKGLAPDEYLRIFSFDIDLNSQSIIISDRLSEKLLYYDLDSFQFKYEKKVRFNYNQFTPLGNGEFIFMDYTGFKDLKKKYYLLKTDTSLNPLHYIYKAPLITSYSLTIGSKTNFFYFQNNLYIYHHLFPYVYKINQEELEPSYRIKFENYQFPSEDFIKKASRNNQDYAYKLENSEYISCYRIDECQSLLCVTFYKNKQPSYAIYHKRSGQGYIFNLPDFFKTIGLGIFLKPVSATEDYIVGQLMPEENSYKYIKDDQLKAIMKNRSIDDNPILCLFKFK